MPCSESWSNWSWNLEAAATQLLVEMLQGAEAGVVVSSSHEMPHVVVLGRATVRSLQLPSLQIPHGGLIEATLPPHLVIDCACGLPVAEHMCLMQNNSNGKTLSMGSPIVWPRCPHFQAFPVQSFFFSFLFSWICVRMYHSLRVSQPAPAVSSLYLSLAFSSNKSFTCLILP